MLISCLLLATAHARARTHAPQIREDAIDCQLPPLDDDPNSETFVSGHIIRILLLRGRMGELLNRRDDGLRIEDRKKRLRQMYVDLAKYYQSLPNLLQFR